GSRNLVGSTCPAPELKRSVSADTSTPSVLLRSYAVVMSADLTAIADQPGSAPRIRAARPATCGEAIDVPERKPKSLSPLGPGATPASTSTPGAATSGLSTSPPLANAGPREENPAMTGVGVGGRSVWSPGSSAAVAAPSPVT